MIAYTTDAANESEHSGPGHLSLRKPGWYWIEGSVIIIFWGLVALLTLAQQVLDPRFDDREGLRSGEALYTVASYGLWAVVTPGIFWLCRRFSLERRKWLGHLVLHIIVGVLVAAVIDLVSHALWNTLVPSGSHRAVSFVFVLQGFHFLAEFLNYLIVLAAGLARGYFLNNQQHQEEAARLQVENLRKTRELQQARQLQLSMLPEAIPSLPGLDIAVYMQTATEVGGDYYDFYQADDETLTIAIGDATGHGLQAGVMVAIVKGLFRITADEPDLTEIARKATKAIKEMNLPRLYMAMTLARFQKHRMQVLAAGMPMPLIYRSAQGYVEELEIKGMPLGGFEQFPYQQKEVELKAGDMVLLMSDGFPELFNAEGEMMGYSKAKDVFGEVAQQTPTEVIQRLNQEVTAWSGGSLKDDITFMVIKVRSVAASSAITEAESATELAGSSNPEDGFAKQLHWLSTGVR